MRIEFTYAPEDLQDLRKLARKVKDPASPRFMGWKAVSSVLVVAATVLFAIASQTVIKDRIASPAPDLPPVVPPTPASPLTSMLLPLIPWILVFGFIWFFVIRQYRGWAKKQYEDNPDLQIRQQLEISDDGISVSTPTNSTWWSWQAFSAVVEGDRTIGVKLAGRAKVFVVIPRPALSPAEQTELRAILAARVRPRSGAFPVTSIPAEQPRP